MTSEDDFNHSEVIPSPSQMSAEKPKPTSSAKKLKAPSKEASYKASKVSRAKKQQLVNKKQKSVWRRPRFPAITFEFKVANLTKEWATNSHRPFEDSNAR